MTRLDILKGARCYNTRKFSTALITEATSTVAGTPQAMGFAIIAGINPIYGLYTAIVSTINGALFRRTAMMTIGPTNALTLVVGCLLLRFEGANPIERLFILTEDI